MAADRAKDLATLPQPRALDRQRDSPSASLSNREPTTTAREADGADTCRAMDEVSRR
jgi:hypothetical protein